ncbi:MAG: hypothetical protein KIT35_22375 [Piscinibacter sp.]|uniref:hypothetical protein n=1 Tax=Piscinibacter sp. TaxID=1903157 RepID=UPI00258C96D0|nr:hypothetical protein [Piscinibacter sp.]MCW5666587.1 hypothetical protein [Piscinibacter sp.]
MAWDYDLFVSYRREPDLALAREVERFLEAFHQTPVDAERVGALRPLVVCVDGSDFSLPAPDAAGAEASGARDVGTVLERYLGRSKELLVLCSRAAALPSFVDDEVRWFLKHRGPGWIRLAFTEGEEPAAAIDEFLPPALRGSDLSKQIAYDLRGYDARRAQGWRKVPPFQEELVRLACDLLGKPAGLVAPSWFRAEMERVRGASLQLAASARYESLLGDPARALLGAVRAHELHPSEQSERALKDAYRVAILHHVNRQAAAQITGSGPSYLAGRWKQGEVFVKTSPDGRWRALVTERGRDGPKPPGEVYLVSNETQRALRLEVPGDARGRVEEVAFDQDSRQVFVTRYFELIVYALDGRVTGRGTYSRWTKSPVPLLAGWVHGRFVAGADAKGGLWLLDPLDRNAGVQLRSEWSRDAVVALDLAPDGRRLAVVLESTRAELIDLEDLAHPQVTVLGERGVLCARFLTDDLLALGSEDGHVRRFERGAAGWTETLASEPLPAPVDWVVRSDDGTLLAAVGADRRIVVLDAATHALHTTLDYTHEVDWRAQLVLPVRPERAWPQDLPASDERLRWPGTPLAVEALRECHGERWIVTSEPDGDYLRRTRAWRLAGDGTAQAVGGAVVDVRALGPLTLLYASYGAGAQALWRDAAGALRVVPSAEASVHAAVALGDTCWIASSKGLYTLRDGQLERVSPADWDVQDLVPIDGRLWVRTRTGVAVVDGGELVRVTENFVEIARIVPAGGAVWLLRPFGTFGSGGGPAIRVDGWLTRELPGRAAVVGAVLDCAGAAWVAEEKRVHRVSGDEMRCIDGLETFADAALASGPTVWLTTRSRGLFTPEGPSYRIDAGARRAQPTGWLSTRLFDTAQGACASFQRDGVLRCARLEPDGADELDLGGAVPIAAQLIDGRLWLLTDRGALRVDGRQLERCGPARPVRALQALGDALWLFGEGWVARRDAGGERVWPTAGLAVTRAVQAGGSDWLLTEGPGPALQVGPARLTRWGPRGGGVREVAEFDGAVWLLTSIAGRPGPARRVQARRGR